jgi:hypothetical protein
MVVVHLQLVSVVYAPWPRLIGLLILSLIPKAASRIICSLDRTLGSVDCWESRSQFPRMTASLPFTAWANAHSLAHAGGLLIVMTSCQVLLLAAFGRSIGSASNSFTKDGKASHNASASPCGIRSGLKALQLVLREEWTLDGSGGVRFVSRQKLTNDPDFHA